jgi:hypothetical protein
MRIVAFITARAVIDRMLDHLRRTHTMARREAGSFDTRLTKSYLTYLRTSDRGKPGESPGRKATGPRLLRDALRRHEGP